MPHVGLSTGQPRVREPLSKAAMVLASTVAVVALAVIGILISYDPLIGLAAAGVVLVLGASGVNLAAVPVIAMAAVVVVARVGGDTVTGDGDGAGGLSVSDLVLFVAVFPALLMTIPRGLSRPTRSILWFSACYQISILFTVIANPYEANVIEWVHEALLVAGAVIVGYAVGRAGVARAGLSVFLLACAAIAVLTIASGIQQLAAGNTSAVYLSFPYGMHKNFIGCVLAFGAVLAYARPRELRWSRSWAWAAMSLCGLGVLAAQSKQGLLSLVVGIAIIALRKEPGRRRSKLIFLPSIPLLIFVVTVTQDQIASNNQFNAVYQRLDWYSQALALWESSPIYGLGLRYWYTGNYPAFQPPNAEIEVVTSAGILGLVGFLILFAGTLWVLWRLDRRLGTVAFALVLMRFVQGQLDLFWVAAQVSIPFLITGVLLGAVQLEQEQRAKSVTDALRPTTARRAARSAPATVREPTR